MDTIYKDDIVWERLTFQYGNAEDKFRYKNNSFDIVYARDVIEHLNKPEFCLSEIKRVLVHGGYLVLSTPNRNCLAYNIKGENIHPEHKFELTPKELREMVKKNSFQVIRHVIKPFPFNYCQVILCKKI